mmetsp:Transcript_33332/g.107853  ORF Transcript_33332/g.107853 Transcript_33332/m.107853 type:complete len:233 (+) Transcript_33332:378-1076(+)
MQRRATQREIANIGGDCGTHPARQAARLVHGGREVSRKPVELPAVATLHAQGSAPGTPVVGPDGDVVRLGVCRLREPTQHAHLEAVDEAAGHCQWRRPPVGGQREAGRRHHHAPFRLQPHSNFGQEDVDCGLRVGGHWLRPQRQFSPQGVPLATHRPHFGGEAQDGGDSVSLQSKLRSRSIGRAIAVRFRERPICGCVETERQSVIRSEGAVAVVGGGERYGQWCRQESDGR